jgi:hypothetical protein
MRLDAQWCSHVIIILIAQINVVVVVVVVVAYQHRLHNTT